MCAVWPVLIGNAVGDGWDFMSTTKYKAGDVVEVYDKDRKLWLRATVVLAWKTTTLPNGLIGEVYDVDGVDDLGSFSGRWDEPFIRRVLPS